MVNTIGHSDTDAAPAVRQRDVCAQSMVTRVAAMLDLDAEQLQDGTALPPGWHFFLLAGDTQRSALRADGFPGFGLPMPDLGLPRLLLGGRTVIYASNLVIGENIERTSQIERMDRKQGPAGPSAVVTVCHELRSTKAASPAIIERQTYILLPAGNPGNVQKSDGSPPTGQKIITPDETQLFMYSALGFNSHKIHLNRDYAQNIEKLPDLIVNGGLVTLLATEFLRTEMGVMPRSLKTRHMAPLYCSRPIAFNTRRDGANMTLVALDETGVTAMEMVVEAA